MESLNAKTLVALQDRLVLDWHGAAATDDDALIGTATNGFFGLVACQHLRNFRLWHVEDEARRLDAGDDHIAAQKRAIDHINQQRQDLIERLDEALIAAWPWVIEDPQLPMNSETPGSVIDRLSIAALKIYHMSEQVGRSDVAEAHRVKCRDRLAILNRQQLDLAGALDELFNDLRWRRKRLQVYRQFKMYNDPTLNPAVYAQGKK